MGMKLITVNFKKRKPKKTQHDIEKIHARQIDTIERFSAVYRLPPIMRTLWEVVFRSGELVAGQVRMLKERTGERWNYYRYWRLRRMLEKELRR